MTALVVALALLLVGAVTAVSVRSSRVALYSGASIGGLACVVGAAGSLACLLDHTERAVRFAWSAPINELSLGVDPLSGFFLLCIFSVGGLALLYAPGYFAHLADHRPLGFAVACLLGLIAAMVVVVLARD